MPGSNVGGKKAAVTNIARYGEEFYATIGSKGGKALHTRPRGFAWMKANGFEDRIKAAGAKGGSRSRRNRHAT